MLAFSGLLRMLQLSTDPSVQGRLKINQNKTIYSEKGFSL